MGNCPRVTQVPDSGCEPAPSSAWRKGAAELALASAEGVAVLGPASPSDLVLAPRPRPPMD